MKKAVLSVLSTSILLGALTGCQPADNEPGPGGVTVGEAQALDEAAEMIEAKRLPSGDTGTDSTMDTALDTGATAPEAASE